MLGLHRFNACDHTTAHMTEQCRTLVQTYVSDLAQTNLYAMIVNFHRSPYFALHKCIAIGFLKAIGFRNNFQRTIFDVWCGDPKLVLI
jgi:hypothetical protein